MCSRPALKQQTIGHHYRGTETAVFHPKLGTIFTKLMAKGRHLLQETGKFGKVQQLSNIGGGGVDALENGMRDRKGENPFLQS